MAPVSSSTPPDIAIPLNVEDLTIERREVKRDVRIHIRTSSHDQLVDEPAMHERVEIEHVAVGRPIDAIPPIREEGDTTVIPVVEEIVVVERRLILKEEIRLRRVRTTERHRETVTLREQQAVIERADPAETKSGPPA
jgi:uncharacterized protein (TIGR02271 family)